MGQVRSTNANEFLEIREVHPDRVQVFFGDGASLLRHDDRIVDARALVAKIAEATGISFHEVSAAKVLSEEQLAILELHRLAKEHDSYLARYAACPGDHDGEKLIFHSEGIERRAPTAVELLAKVRVAMKPRRTAAQIKEDIVRRVREGTYQPYTTDPIPGNPPVVYLVERDDVVAFLLAEAEGKASGQMVTYGEDGRIHPWKK